MGNYGSRARESATAFTNNGQFVFDLVEFWIAGVVGLAIFGSIVITIVHGGLPWECEEHVKLVSGAANLGLSHNGTTHYDCEYLTSTAGHATTGMCSGTGCTDEIKKTICDAHSKSLGCKWYASGVDNLPAKTEQFNSDRCSANGSVTSPVNKATAGCCLYKPPVTDDQMHDVCYSIDQYVKDDHYPNFVGSYKDKVEDARTWAILSYVFGLLAFFMRVIYHLPFLTNTMFGADKLEMRDRGARMADTVFLIAAFVFTIMTFMDLDDVLIDNRKHLWGTGGVFKDKTHVDKVEEQIVASTGFYVLAVYATFLGINSVWFLGTTSGIIPVPAEHSANRDVELRGIAFRSEHA